MIVRERIKVVEAVSAQRVYTCTTGDVVSSSDINGGVRDLFHPDSTWVSVDLHDGPGVDVVADCRIYRHPDPVDVVVCCEVAEHCDGWHHMVVNAADHLGAGGVFIFTAAGPGRAPHGAWGAAAPGNGEWYSNVAPRDLEAALHAGFDGGWEVDQAGYDVRAVAHVV